MKNRGLSQEGLKLIACVTMLLDHIGATVVLRYLQNPVTWNPDAVALYYALRIIGRIAFPIYCFLLVEGSCLTRNPRKYALRLAVGMLLAEIPFDLAFSMKNAVFDWSANSVMVTLLLGFLMMEVMKRTEGILKLAAILPFYLLAELLRTDYGGLGILVIAMLYLTRGLKQEKLLRLLGFAAILIPGMRTIRLGSIWVNMESFAVLAAIPIFCYDGRKLTNSKAVQWMFYLFYPVHILALWLLEKSLFG